MLYTGLRGLHRRNFPQGVPGFMVLFQRAALTALVAGLLIAGGASTRVAPAQTTAARPSNTQLADPAIERKVDALLARMTLEEKIGQLVQYSASEASAPAAAANGAALNVNPPGPNGIDSYKLAQAGELGSMLNTVGQQLTNHFQHAAVDNTRLHIPLLFGADVIHGYRTIFPVPLATASSWDPDLIAQLAPHGRVRGQNRGRRLGLLADGRYRARCTLGPLHGRRG